MLKKFEKFLSRSADRKMERTHGVIYGLDDRPDILTTSNLALQYVAV